MLDIITWLWKPAKIYRSQYAPEHVNILRRQVARYYPHPHRFSVITDQTEGFDAEIRVIPLWSDFAGRESIYGPDAPSCYRRLRAFGVDMARIIGSRFVSLDLDAVALRDLTPVFHRPEEFVIWGGKHRRTPYNGSMWMMDAGCRADVWERFKKKPEYCIQKALRAGFYGSDQAWLNYALGPNQPRWDEEDGVYSFRMNIKNNGGVPPDDARIVFFEGNYNPWDEKLQAEYPWIKEHYC